VLLRPLRALEQQSIDGGGEVGEVVVALGMFSKGHEDVMPAMAGDDREVVEPVFPGAGFSQDLEVAASETSNEFVRFVRDVRRGEDLAHRTRGFGRNKLALLEQQAVAKELADGGGVGVVCYGVADAFIGLAVMLAEPNAAAVGRVVEMVRV